MRDLSEQALRVLNNEPFLAHLSALIEKRPVLDLKCKTMMITYTKSTKNVHLSYYPPFLSLLTPRDTYFMLRHELYHYMFGHITNRPLSTYPKKVRAYAVDLAVNSCMPDIHEWSLNFRWSLPEDDLGNGLKLVRELITPGVGLFTEYPAGQTAEWYAAQIMKDFADQPEFFDDDFEDSHEYIDDLDFEELEFDINNMIDTAISNMNHRGTRNWGNVPHEIIKKYEERLKPPISPEDVLSKFFQHTIRANKKSSLLKINKRKKYRGPGHLVRKCAKLMIAIDESGSMSDELMKRIFALVEAFSHLISFTVVPFDEYINEAHVFEWKKGMSVDMERRLSGGTNFTVPTNYANERDFDGVLFITDMGSAIPPRTKAKRVWLTTKENMTHAQAFRDNLGDEIIFMN